MSWAWTRTFYAIKNGVIYNFEAKKQRDIAIKDLNMSKYPASEAYKNYSNIVRVGYHDFNKWKEGASNGLYMDKDH